MSYMQTLNNPDNTGASHQETQDLLDRAREEQHKFNRQQHIHKAKDPTLPFLERAREGTSALVEATRELSEGGKREYKEYKNKKNKSNKTPMANSNNATPAPASHPQNPELYEEHKEIPHSTIPLEKSLEDEDSLERIRRREEQQKELRRQYSSKMQNPSLPLADRVKAGTFAVVAGAKEFTEGGKREYKSYKNKRSKDDVVPPTNNQSTHPESHLSDNEPNPFASRENVHTYANGDHDHHHDESPHEKEMSAREREVRLKEKRSEKMRKAMDPNLTLTDRAKAGTFALVAGAKEFTEGGKREFNAHKSKKKEAEAIKHTHAGQPNTTAQNGINLKKSAENTEHLNRTAASVPVEPVAHTINPNHVSDSLNNHADEYVHIPADEDAAHLKQQEEDQVHLHRTREEQHTKLRKQYTSKVKDPHLTLAERVKAGTGALFEGAKEFSEGGKREYKARKYNKSELSPRSDEDSPPRYDQADDPEFDGTGHHYVHDHSNQTLTDRAKHVSGSIFQSARTLVNGKKPRDHSYRDHSHEHPPEF